MADPSGGVSGDAFSADLWGQLRGLEQEAFNERVEELGGVEAVRAAAARVLGPKEEIQMGFDEESYKDLSTDYQFKELRRNIVTYHEFLKWKAAAGDSDDPLRGAGEIRFADDTEHTEDATTATLFSKIRKKTEQLQSPNRRASALQTFAECTSRVRELRKHYKKANPALTGIQRKHLGRTAEFLRALGDFLVDQKDGLKELEDSQRKRIIKLAEAVDTYSDAIRALIADAGEDSAGFTDHLRDNNTWKEVLEMRFGIINNAWLFPDDSS